NAAIGSAASSDAQATATRLRVVCRPGSRPMAGGDRPGEGPQAALRRAGVGHGDGPRAAFQRGVGAELGPGGPPPVAGRLVHTGADGDVLDPRVPWQRSAGSASAASRTAARTRALRPPVRRVPGRTSGGCA